MLVQVPLHLGLDQREDLGADLGLAVHGNLPAGRVDAVVVILVLHLVGPVGGVAARFGPVGFRSVDVFGVRAHLFFGGLVHLGHYFLLHLFLLPVLPRPRRGLGTHRAGLGSIAGNMRAVGVCIEWRLGRQAWVFEFEKIREAFWLKWVTGQKNSRRFLKVN